VVLTHAHYDHSVNFVLFPHATVWIGAEELAWRRRGRRVSTHCRNSTSTRSTPIRASAGLRRARKSCPGCARWQRPDIHPDRSRFHLTANDVPVLFTGDAAKNRAELLSCEVDATEDAAAKPRVDRHDLGPVARRPRHPARSRSRLAMQLDARGRPTYVGERRAGISAWFGETLEEMMEFDFKPRETVSPPVVPAKAGTSSLRGRLTFRIASITIRFSHRNVSDYRAPAFRGAQVGCFARSPPRKRRVSGAQDQSPRLATILGSRLRGNERSSEQAHASSPSTTCSVIPSIRSARDASALDSRVCLARRARVRPETTIPRDQRGRPMMAMASRAYGAPPGSRPSKGSGRNGELRRLRTLRQVSSSAESCNDPAFEPRDLLMRVASDMQESAGEPGRETRMQTRAVTHDRVHLAVADGVRVAWLPTGALVRTVGAGTHQRRRDLVGVPAVRHRDEHRRRHRKARSGTAMTSANGDTARAAAAPQRDATLNSTSFTAASATGREIHNTGSAPDGGALDERQSPIHLRALGAFERAPPRARAGNALCWHETGGRLGGGHRRDNPGCAHVRRERHREAEMKRAESRIAASPGLRSHARIGRLT